MKKTIVFFLSVIMIAALTLPTYAYYLSPEEIYGEPDKGYDEGYEDGFEDGGGRVIYKTREVGLEKYVADHETRFRELYITFFLVIGICIIPTVIFRHLIAGSSFDSFAAASIAGGYHILAGCLITYILYRIDYLMPCTSIIILSGMICKKILYY